MRGWKQRQSEIEPDETEAWRGAFFVKALHLFP